MLNWIKAQTVSERIEYETDRRLVLIVLGISIFAMSFLFIVNISRELVFVIDLALVGAFILALRGKLEIAGMFGPFGALVVCTLLMLRNYGIRDTAVLGLPVVIVAASLMNGQKGAIFYGIASLMVVIGIGLAEFSGLLQNIFSIHNTLADYLVVCIVIVMTVAMQWAVIARIMSHIRMKNRELTERLKAEEEKAAYSQELEILYKLALELSELPPEKSLDEFFAYKLKDLTQAIFVSLSQYNPVEKQLEMRQLIINNKILNQVVQILGIDPRTMVIPINGAIYQKIIREAVGYYQNLSEATFGAISPAMASTLQTIFNVDQFVGLGILYNGELEAAIMLILQKGSPVPSQRFLKALANLAAIAFWRKKADQARLESETRFQQMAELLPQGIFECTPEGQITYANQRAAEMFGYQAFRSSNHFINMFAEEKREMILEIFNAIVAGFPFGQHEFQVARRDGSLFPALIYASAIIRDGQSTGIRGVIVDITELKLVERSLQRSNRFLRATSRCNMALVHATDAQSLFNEICVILVEEIFYSFAWIGLFADDRKLVITPVASAGLKNTHLIPVETNTRSGSSINGLSPLEFLPMLEAIQREEAVLIRDIASDLRCQPIWAEAEATQLKSVISLPLIYSGQVFGGITVYARHANAFAPEEVKVLQEMSSDVAFGIHTLQIRADRDQAIVHLEEVNQKLSEAYDATLLGWSLALELRERETAGHSQRVVRLTLLLAEKMGVPAEKLIDIRWGAYLHDIGKIGIPDSILLKPEPLMDDEWQVMRQHPIYAYRLISSIAFLKNAVNIPYLHHERWDGSGYPLHLKGDEIPLAARIFMVVDVWDALVYDRPYRSAWSAEKTRGYLHENAGILFDPKVVTAFLELLEVEEGNGYEID